MSANASADRTKVVHARRPAWAGSPEEGRVVQELVQRGPKTDARLVPIPRGGPVRSNRSTTLCFEKKEEGSKFLANKWRGPLDLLDHAGPAPSSGGCAASERGAGSTKKSGRVVNSSAGTGPTSPSRAFPGISRTPPRRQDVLGLEAPRKRRRKPGALTATGFRTPGWGNAVAWTERARAERDALWGRQATERAAHVAPNDGGGQ